MKRIGLFSFVHPDLVPPVHQIALSYQAKGIDVDIVSFGYPKSYRASGTGAISYSYLDLYQGSFLRKLILQFQFFNQLRKHKRDHQYDAILAFCPGSFFHATVVFGKEKLVLSCLEIYESWRFRLSFDSLFAWFFEQRINGCKRVYVPSSERADYFHEKYRLQRKPGTLLNAPFYNGKESVDRSPKGSPVRILHSGGLNSSRGIMELLNGFALLDPTKFELHITNFGTDPYSGQVNDFVAHRELKNVRLWPMLPRDQLEALQRSCHVGICFIKSSGSVDTELIAPNKLGEYLLRQLICVVSDQRYFRLLGDHEFIIPCSLSDPLGIAKAIEDAAARAVRADIGELIRNFVSTWYNMEIQLLINSLIQE